MSFQNIDWPAPGHGNPAPQWPQQLEDVLEDLEGRLDEAVVNFNDTARQEFMKLAHVVHAVSACYLASPNPVARQWLANFTTFLLSERVKYDNPQGYQVFKQRYAHLHDRYRYRFPTTSTKWRHMKE